MNHGQPSRRCWRATIGVAIAGWGRGAVWASLIRRTSAGAGFMRGQPRLETSVSVQTSLLYASARVDAHVLQICVEFRQIDEIFEIEEPAQHHLDRHQRHQ